MRPVSLAFALAAVLAVPAASAGASTTLCNLVVDPAQDGPIDTQFGSVLNPVEDPRFDIVSGDLASDADVVTAVLRLKDLATTLPTTDASYTAFWFAFTAEEGTRPRFWVSADVDLGGPAVGSLHLQGHPDADFAGQQIGSATVVVDVPNDEVRITADLAEFAPYAAMAAGTELSGMHLVTRMALGSWDHAFSDAVYPLGAASCVTP